MKIEVRGATPIEVAQFFSTSETVYDLVKIGGEVVAMAGFVWEGARLWAVLDIKRESAVPTILLVRGLLRGLRRRGGVIHTVCDHLKYPGAPRLLTALGFRPTTERRGSHGEYGVWTWN
jgi:hypothetical protein